MSSWIIVFGVQVDIGSVIPCELKSIGETLMNDYCMLITIPLLTIAHFGAAH